jgi:hypothetical protein
MNKQLTEEEFKEAAIETLKMLQKVNFIIKKQRESEIGMEMLKSVGEEAKKTKCPPKTIERVEFPQEGGMLSFLEGCEYPKKGFACSETVENVDEVKKQAMSIVRGIERIVGGSKLKTLLLYILFKRQIKEMIYAFTGTLFAIIRRYRSKPILYCDCVREIYRVFNIFILIERDEKKQEFLEQLRDIVCMVLEFDDAYRYRFQDIYPEIDYKAIKEDPIKEIRRVGEIFIEREENSSMKKKWEMFNKFIGLIRFKKDMKLFVERFITEIDMDKIKMDEADSFHCQIKEGYMWTNLIKKIIKKEPKKEPEEEEEKEKEVNKPKKENIEKNRKKRKKRYKNRMMRS